MILAGTLIFFNEKSKCQWYLNLERKFQNGESHIDIIVLLMLFFLWQVKKQYISCPQLDKKTKSLTGSSSHGGNMSWLLLFNNLILVSAPLGTGILLPPGHSFRHKLVAGFSVWQGLQWHGVKQGQQTELRNRLLTSDSRALQGPRAPLPEIP